MKFNRNDVVSMAIARSFHHLRPGNIANHPRKLANCLIPYKLLKGGNRYRCRKKAKIVWNNIWPFIISYTRIYYTVLYEFTFWLRWTIRDRFFYWKNYRLQRTRAYRFPQSYIKSIIIFIWHTPRIFKFFWNC